MTRRQNVASTFILTNQRAVGSNPTSSAKYFLIIEYMISLINYLREKLICHFENTNIFEMTKHRTDFRNEIESIIKTLFQHYCLVRYCVRYDFGNINKDHWCEEIFNYIDDIQDITTKGYDKTRAIRYVLIDDMELNNIDNPFFIKHLNKKFDKENIKLTDEEKDALITDFINVLNILIKTLGFSWKDKHNKDYISAKDFINYYILHIER